MLFALALVVPTFWNGYILSHVRWLAYAGLWTLHPALSKFLAGGAPTSDDPRWTADQAWPASGVLTPPGARQESSLSPQVGAPPPHSRNMTMAFTHMRGGQFFIPRTHYLSISPLERWNGPCWPLPAPRPRPHPTNPLFVHFLTKVTEWPLGPSWPLLTTAPPPGHAPPGPTNLLFVHLTIRVTESPLDPRCHAPPPSLEPTICPFTH